MKTDTNAVAMAKEALKDLCENPEKQTKANMVLALKDEILAARSKGISFKTIEKALLNAGIEVSMATIIRNIKTKSKKTNNFVKKPNKYTEL